MHHIVFYKKNKKQRLQFNEKDWNLKNILWTHATHVTPAKISTHATHAIYAKVLTHAKALWTLATHVTHFKNSTHTNFCNRRISILTHFMPLASLVNSSVQVMLDVIMCSIKKVALENFTKFTRKHVHWNLFFLFFFFKKKDPSIDVFTLNFVLFLRAAISWNTFERLHHLIICKRGSKNMWNEKKIC